MAVPTCHARYDPGQTLSAFKLYYWTEVIASCGRSTLSLVAELC